MENELNTKQLLAKLKRTCAEITRHNKKCDETIKLSKELAENPATLDSAIHGFMTVALVTSNEQRGKDAVKLFYDAVEKKWDGSSGNDSPNHPNPVEALKDYMNAFNCARKGQGNSAVLNNLKKISCSRIGQLLDFEQVYAPYSPKYFVNMGENLWLYAEACQMIISQHRDENIVSRADVDLAIDSLLDCILEMGKIDFEKAFKAWEAIDSFHNYFGSPIPGSEIYDKLCDKSIGVGRKLEKLRPPIEWATKLRSRRRGKKAELAQ